jgi:hypothetical protein
MLNDPSGQITTYWVDDFETAAANVLKWLEGGDALDIVEAAKLQIVKGPQFNLSVSDLSGK